MGARLSRALLWAPGSPCSQALTAGPPGDSLWAGVSACGVGGKDWRRRPWCTPTGPQDISPTRIHCSRRQRGLQDVRTHLGQNPSSHRPGLSPTVSAAPSSAGKAGPPWPAFTFRKRPGWTTAPCWPLGWTFSCLCIRTMVSDAPRPRPPPETQLKQETQTQLPETLAGPHMAAPSQLFFK